MKDRIRDQRIEKRFGGGRPNQRRYARNCMETVLIIKQRLKTIHT